MSIIMFVVVPVAGGAVVLGRCLALYINTQGALRMAHPAATVGCAKVTEVTLREHAHNPESLPHQQP